MALFVRQRRQAHHQGVCSAFVFNRGEFDLVRCCALAHQLLALGPATISIRSELISLHVVLANSQSSLKMKGEAASSKQKPGVLPVAEHAVLYGVREDVLRNMVAPVVFRPRD